MRFRTHLIVSALAGLALYPRRPARAGAVLLAGTLLDLDHLLLYAVKTGDWSVTGALRYDRYRGRRRDAGDTRPRYGPLRSWLHEPWLLLPPVWAVAASRPWLRPVALGLSLHLLLDQYDWPLQLLTLALARGRCALCGRAGLRLAVHRLRQPEGLRHKALCRTCAEAALQGGPLGPARLPGTA